MISGRHLSGYDCRVCMPPGWRKARAFPRRRPSSGGTTLHPDRRPRDANPEKDTQWLTNWQTDEFAKATSEEPTSIHSRARKPANVRQTKAHARERNGQRKVGLNGRGRNERRPGHGASEGVGGRPNVSKVGAR